MWVGRDWCFCYCNGKQCDAVIVQANHIVSPYTQDTPIIFQNNIIQIRASTFSYAQLRNVNIFHASGSAGLTEQTGFYCLLLSGKEIHCWFISRFVIPYSPEHISGKEQFIRQW
jgi:hypothetical protein